MNEDDYRTINSAKFDSKEVILYIIRGIMRSHPFPPPIRMGLSLIR